MEEASSTAVVEEIVESGDRRLLPLTSSRSTREGGPNVVGVVSAAHPDVRVDCVRGVVVDIDAAAAWPSKPVGTHQLTAADPIALSLNLSFSDATTTPSNLSKHSMTARNLSLCIHLTHVCRLHLVVASQRIVRPLGPLLQNTGPADGEGGERRYTHLLMM